MQSTIKSDRLLLRAFSLEDAAGFARLAGNRLIADTTPASSLSWPRAPQLILFSDQKGLLGSPEFLQSGGTLS